MINKKFLNNNKILSSLEETEKIINSLETLIKNNIIDQNDYVFSNTEILSFNKIKQLRLKYFYYLEIAKELMKNEKLNYKNFKKTFDEVFITEENIINEDVFKQKIIEKIKQA